MNRIWKAGAFLLAMTKRDASPNIRWYKLYATENGVKKEYDNLNRKPNKTPDDKNKLDKLKRALKRLKDKMDFKGENHSRNAKGNR